jgi:hypothetical protein
MRTLTVQSGTYSNWVGSHYWSALCHDSHMPESEYSNYYNESRGGVLTPRLFWIDAADSIGTIHASPEPELDDTGESPVTSSHETPVHVIHQDDVSEQDNGTARYWTDFFELPQLPPNRLIVPTALKPTESRFKYWFEYESFSADKADETQLRSH